MSALLDTFIFRAVPWLYIVRTDFLRATGITFLPGIIHEDEHFTATLTLSCRRMAVLVPALLHGCYDFIAVRQTEALGDGE